MHQRRDRRFPFYSGGPEAQTVAGSATALAEVEPEMTVVAPEQDFSPDVTVNRLDSSAEQALRLWLRWNAAHEKVSACMFKPGHDRQQLEDLMDQLDQMRDQAVRLSEKLIA